MSISAAQQYCLRWNNHSSNFVTVFEQLLKSEAFTDVTVSVHDGTSIKCHKMVLAACSSYFQDLFIKNPCEHPIIILSDVKYCEIKAILDYMYKGEVNVAQDQLPGLLKVAGFLKVKGLVEDSESSGRTEVEPSLSPPPAISTSSMSNIAHSSGYVSPSHVPSSTYIPYGKSPVERNHNHMPLWAAFSGLPLPQHPISGHQPPPRSQHSILGSSYENSSETSPLSRKKLSSLMANRDTPILRNVLGQGHADSSQGICALYQDRQDASYCSNSNGSTHDSDRRNSAELSESMIDDDEKVPAQNYAIGNKSGGPKPEWKRYKQYTREHISDAMNAVRNKEMSALQAARKYGVPSRTLYDKLKKAGILPSRGAAVLKRESSHSGSARFPYTSSMNGSVYGGGAGAALSESESDTNGTPGVCKMEGIYDSSLAMDMSTSTRSPSPTPVMVSASASGHGSQIDDQVEDLSLGRGTMTHDEDNTNESDSSNRV